MTAARLLMMVDLKNHRIRIHKSTLRALGQPDYVLLLVNPKERMIALLKSDRSNGRAHFVPWAALKSNKSYELHSTSLLNQLMALSDWEENQAYRIYGSVDGARAAAQFRIADALKYVCTPKRGDGDVASSD